MSIQQLQDAIHIGGDAAMRSPMQQRGSGAWVALAAATEAWEREHEAEWARVDQKLRGIASRRAALDAEEANLLRYAEELKLWRAYGFGSLLEYMERAMGYAPHTAAERLRVARAIAELPLIAEALEQGELAHSAVRELSRVAIPDTEGAWLEAARGKSLRQIEVMVSGHKPGHLPTDETEPHLYRKKITLEVSPETYDIWRRMHALAAEEHGQRLSDDELIPALFRRAYGVEGARVGGGSSASSKEAGTPVYKIAIKQCPECKRAWQYSGGRDIEIDPAVAECAACDAVHLGSLDAAGPERATTTVTARKREQVLARDGYCCAVPGCRRNIGLDLHHIEFQSRGGGHELSNLTTICDLHHRAVHYGKLTIRGRAPDHLTFEFRRPRDRRNVTDDDVLDSPVARTAISPSSPAHATSSADTSTSGSPTRAQRPPRDAVKPSEIDGTNLPESPPAPAPHSQSHADGAAKLSVSATSAQSHVDRAVDEPSAHADHAQSRVDSGKLATEHATTDESAAQSHGDCAATAGVHAAAALPDVNRTATAGVHAAAALSHGDCAAIVDLHAAAAQSHGDRVASVDLHAAAALSHRDHADRAASADAYAAAAQSHRDHADRAASADAYAAAALPDVNRTASAGVHAAAAQSHGDCAATVDLHAAAAQSHRDHADRAASADAYAAAALPDVNRTISAGMHAAAAQSHVDRVASVDLHAIGAQSHVDCAASAGVHAAAAQSHGDRAASADLHVAAAQSHLNREASADLHAIGAQSHVNRVASTGVHAAAPSPTGAA